MSVKKSNGEEYEPASLYSLSSDRQICDSGKDSFFLMDKEFEESRRY